MFGIGEVAVFLALAVLMGGLTSAIVVAQDEHIMHPPQSECRQCGGAFDTNGGIFCGDCTTKHAIERNKSCSEWGVAYMEHRKRFLPIRTVTLDNGFVLHHYERYLGAPDVFMLEVA